MSNKLRILHLIKPYRPVYTGMGIQVEEVGKRLVSRGMDLTVACGTSPGARAAEPEAVPPVQRFDLPMTRNPLTAWRSARGILRLLDGARFDVVHSFGFINQLPFIMDRAQQLSSKTVMTGTLLDADDPVTLSRGRFTWLRRRMLRRMDAYTMLAPALADRFRPAGLTTDNVRVIPPGVDTENFPAAENRDALASQLGWDPSAPRALFAGAVIHRKGVDILLDAWGRISRSLPQARLYIAGPEEFDDPAWGAFVRNMHERGLREFKESVRFLGRVDDRRKLAAMFRAAHVFLFPSRAEGFGIVIAESSAAGTPVVVTDMPGITNYNLRHGETGLVVPQADPEALAESALRLLKNPELRENMGAAARRDVEARFSLDAVAGQYEELYRELAGG